MVDGGMGSGGCTMVRWSCMVGSRGGAVVRWGSVVGSSMMGCGMVRGRVGRSLSMRGVGGARAVVGLTRVGDIGDIARVLVVHMVGHGLMGNPHV